MKSCSHPVMYKTDVSSGHISVHQSCDFLFIYILSGSGAVAINGKTIPINKGNGLLIARNEKATFKPAIGAALQMVHVHLAEAAVEHYLLHNATSLLRLSNDTKCIQLIPNHLLLQSFVSGIDTGVEQGFCANEPLTFLKVQECINMLVYLRPEIHNWLFLMNHSQKVNLNEFMEKYYRENIPLEQLAQTAGRSLSTFRRDFLKEFAMTPGKWLLARRLDEAYQLITQKKLNPSSFLLDLGFESFSHFSRSFKVRFGIQPSILLKQI